MERSFVCAVCGRSFGPETAIWRCPCGGYLNVPLAQGLSRQAVEYAEPSLWRYRAVLPSVGEGPAAYFGEGLTPLVERNWGGRRVDFKLDYLFPSGSFKDRGAAVMVNGLRAIGVKSIREDSSGNGGAAVAGYCAAAGMSCTVYTPASASPGKLVQISAYGARLVKVPGSRQDTALAAMSAEDGSFYASHNWHPWFIEGVKTLGYEIWEQCEWSAPDVLVVPIGYGSTVLGTYRGMKELVGAGSIARVPRIYACQSANCPTFDRAWRAQSQLPVSDDGRCTSTVAEGVVATHPIRVPDVMAALRETSGRTVVVPEDEIVTALFDLARIGLYVEPTSCVAPAAARHLIIAGEIKPNERVVVVLTGSGLKATALVESLRSRMHPEPAQAPNEGVTSR